MKNKCGQCRWLTGNKSTIGIACENPKREGKWRTRVSHYKYRTTPACKDYEPKDAEEQARNRKEEQRQ